MADEEITKEELLERLNTVLPPDTLSLLEKFIKTTAGSGGITQETDPIFNTSPAKNISSGDLNFIQNKDYNSMDNLPDLSLKADLVGGRVPASQLPSFVDDVIEGANLTALNALPIEEKQEGKLYVALDTNRIYRWSGSVFVDMTQSPNLTTLGGVLPTVKIIDYTQDATNYMLRVSYTYGQATLSLPLFEVRIHSANLLAQNITITQDSVNQSTSSTQNGIAINGFVTTILIPKATNTSPIWNNDIAGIMVRLIGVDNGDGGTTSTKIVRRIASDMALIGTIKPKQDLLVSGTNIKTINGNTILGNGNLVVTSAKNEAGQVKVNYTGLSVSNFTNNVSKQFNIGAATPTIVASPTTRYPNSTPNSYTGFFDSARNGGTTTFPGRLIENPIQGQPHRFRIQGTYSNKASNNTGALDIIIRNPVSGNTFTRSITLPDGRTTGGFDEVILVIADNASILSPNGYILEAQTSFTDTNLTINITSITRFSDAIEP